MDAVKLKQLLKKDEGPKLDFKAEIHLETESEKKELTKDVTAIANSRGGRGHIIFGVQDKTKKLIGIEPGGFTEEQIQQIIYNRSDPPVPVSVEFIEYEGFLLAVITIYKSNHRPHQILQTGAFYVRRGSTTDVARRNEIAGMFQESGFLSYETVAIKNSSLEDLDQESIRKYLGSIGAADEKLSEVLMEAMGFISDGEQGVKGTSYYPTVGGLLLFGKNPWKFLPNVYVKIVNEGKVQYIYGNITTMLNSAMAAMRELNVPDGYPFDALEEVVANALVHRDYLDMSRGVLIYITDKSIEISNPGALLSGNSVYNSVRERNPIRRNPWLYQRLLTADPGKRFVQLGTGMSRVRNAFKEIGQVKFVNAGSQNLFKVILPR